MPGEQLKSAKPTGPKQQRAQRARAAKAVAARTPPARPRRARAKASKPAGSGHMDPLDPTLIPVTRTQAKALPIMGMSRVEAFLQTSRQVWFITNTGRSGTLMMRVAIPASGSATVTVHTAPLLAATDDAGGPTSGRAMKAGVTLVNNTADINAGGRVYVLRSDQRMKALAAPSTMTIAQWNTLANEIIAHPEARAHSGKDFQRPMHFHASLADAVDYENFAEWMGTDTADTFGQHVFVWPGVSPDTRPLSTICVVMETTALAQDYTVTARGTWYTRWPLDSIGGQVQTDVPVASAKAVDSATRAPAGGVR